MSVECASAVKALVLVVLPVELVACVKLCSISALAKDVHRGVAECAFLMHVKPDNPVATMEVDIDVRGTNGEDGSVQNGPTHWD